METSLKAASINAINSSLESYTDETNSLHDHVLRTTGHVTSKTITLSANNTTASENIFQITGTVQVFRLYAEVVDATTLTNCTAASFDLYPTGGAAAQITAASGVLSGVGVGSYITKQALKASAFNVADNSAAVVNEAAVNRTFTGFVATQKTGTDTFIRFTYTTTDAPINAQIKVYIEYRGLGTGTLVAV